jgi:hypothetical protein
MNDDYKTFVFSYSHDGSRWGLEIKARDAADAKARIARLPYATFDGELMASIPASPRNVERAPLVVASDLAGSSSERSTRH